MWLASFPPAEVRYGDEMQCEPGKVVVTLQGPPSAPLAHSIDPITPVPEKKAPVRRRVAVDTPQVDEFQVHAEERRMKKQAILKKIREEFKSKGAMKALYGAIEQKVQSACMSTDHLLIQKKSRLRELLLAEDIALTKEYVASCQQAKANRDEELRRRAVELQDKLERERKEIADMKLLQQKVLSCDPARPTLTQKQLKEVKQDQLWQIKQKYALEEVRREEDKMYHDLMMKNILALKEEEEEQAKLAWKRKKDAQKAFFEQMKWKEEREEQERRLKEFERVQLEEESRVHGEAAAREKAEQELKRAKIKAEFRELLQRDRAIKERRKREDEEIERAFNELMALEAEKEKRKEKSTKERLKREMDSFIEKSKELKKMQEEEERKCDQMLEELNEKKRQQKEAERRRLREARAELFHDVLRGREEQIKEKQERERQKAEQERLEIELLTAQIEQQDKIRADYERRCAEQREQYRCQLLEQIEEEKQKRIRQKEEEEKFAKLLKEKEEKEIEEVKYILNNLPIFPNDHPMKTIASTQPPKYPCMQPYM